MKEQAYLIESNSIRHDHQVAQDRHEVKRWIARNGSGQGLVGYSVILVTVSVVAAILYGISVGTFNSMLIAIISSMP